MATQRARIAADLAPHAQRLGGDSAAEGTTGAALHRGWIDIKSRLRRHDDNAILTEVERGDGITLHAFQDALEGMLPPDSRAVVERLYAELGRLTQRLRRSTGSVTHKREHTVPRGSIDFLRRVDLRGCQAEVASSPLH